MLKRLAPLVPLALITLLAACASPPQMPSGQVSARSDTAAQHADHASRRALDSETDSQEEPASQLGERDYELPSLADSILSHGLALVGTRYRYGGTSVKSGFDCSGFIGYLFHEEIGVQLPRSTREMINIDAPLVERDELEPGDLLFFSTNGRGRVSHAGIYMGDDQFIHSSSSRSGGVRIDSLEDRYWNRTFIEAKRALVLAPSEQSHLQR
nr:NlpC/P60 family protein [uncultured Pseudomonas sp.]